MNMDTNTCAQEPVSTRAAGCEREVFERYYGLVHWLRALGDMPGVALKTIGVTACARGAGTSTVASNLAVAAAQISEEPVLLLDLTDMRPATATRFTASDDFDLHCALADVLRPGECASATPISNLWRIAATQLSEFHASTMDPACLGELLRLLEQSFGVVVVDLPIVESSLCFVAAKSLNGMLLVIEAECTDGETAACAKQRLIDARANVLGVILNKHCQQSSDWLNAQP